MPENETLLTLQEAIALLAALLAHAHSSILVTDDPEIICGEILATLPQVVEGIRRGGTVIGILRERWPDEDPNDFNIHLRDAVLGAAQLMIAGSLHEVNQLARTAFDTACQSWAAKRRTENRLKRDVAQQNLFTRIKTGDVGVFGYRQAHVQMLGHGPRLTPRPDERIRISLDQLRDWDIEGEGADAALITDIVTFSKVRVLLPDVGHVHHRIAPSEIINSKPDKKPRARDTENDAKIKTNINTVLAVARRLIKSGASHRGQSLAQAVIDADGNCGYDKETVTKIVNGTYPTMDILGIRKL